MTKMIIFISDSLFLLYVAASLMIIITIYKCIKAKKLETRNIDNETRNELKTKTIIISFVFHSQFPNQHKYKITNIKTKIVTFRKRQTNIIIVNRKNLTIRRTSKINKIIKNLPSITRITNIFITNKS